MFSSSRRAKSLAYGVIAVATSGTAIYAFSGDNNAFRPKALSPRYDENGKYIAPKFPRVKTRQEHLAALRQDSSNGKTLPSEPASKTDASKNSEIYDLLIIGGGATGTGIALDAVTRGLKVALIERDDFSSGTSSKSTKLLHGGVRYLEKAVWNLDYEQFKLVQEALRERKHFSLVAPHLASWLPVLLPLKSWVMAPYFWAGTKAYDLLAGSRGYKGSYFLGKRGAIDAFPMLKRDGLIGALVYYDGQHNDSRVNISLAMTAAMYDATMLNHVEATELVKDSNGKICGAKVRDMIPPDEDQNSEFTVRARGVINATGPFVDAIRGFDNPADGEIVKPSTGVHVVLPSHFCPSDIGLIDPNTSDGRVMFVLPWEGRTLVGTTDTPCKVTENPVAEENDIDWILKEIRGYLAPGMSLHRSDVLAAWSGIRPLVKDPKATNTESLVRNHLVTVSESGLLTCAGGKWTTYRQMAEDAVDKAIEVFNLHPRTAHRDALSHASLPEDFNDAPFMDGSCQTQSIRLVGAHAFHPTLIHDLIRQHNLEADIATHLVHSYGDRAWEVARLSSAQDQRLAPNHPFVDGEIKHAMQSELAETATDVLARRMRLAFIDVQAALKALPRVIDVMGEQLKWDEKRMETEWKDSVEFLKSMGLPENQFGVTRQEVLSGLVVPDVVSEPNGLEEVPRKTKGKGKLILQGVSTTESTTPKIS